MGSSEQIVEVIVDHGYRPQSIVARAGVPLSLVFRRHDTDECMDRVVFSSPHIDRRLARDGTTTVVLPAQPPGAIRFTCGMGRYHGEIQLQAARSSPIQAFRARITRRLQRKRVATMTSSRPTPTVRTERRALILEERRAERDRLRSPEHQAQEQRRARIRQGAFVLVMAAVLGGGVYLAAGDLFGQRGAATTAGVIPVRLSMAGFTPGDVKVPAGQTVSLELWTTDAAPHLQNGVHTMISDELDIYEELPAAGMSGESRRVVTIQTPTMPGTYDIYCATCCGGKDSPTMHGKLIVEA